MWHAREIPPEEENFRIERRGSFEVVRRDPIEPEPVGTIVLKAFRITGYDVDCDGSLMASLENIDCDIDPTGWDTRSIGIAPGDTLVVTEEELRALFKQP